MRRWCCHWTDMHCKLHGSHLLLQGRRFHPKGIQGMLTQPRAHENRINTPGIFCKLQGQLFSPASSVSKISCRSHSGFQPHQRFLMFLSLRLASTTPQGRWQKASRAWRLAVSAARPPPVARHGSSGWCVFGHQRSLFFWSPKYKMKKGWKGRLKEYWDSQLGYIYIYHHISIWIYIYIYSCKSYYTNAHK